ncbi:4Fe-4S binding protein [Candidatus Eisenbacteria bacterium]|uniref:4Fe-4S binding protein n=1 Tax=Eiseniibacteriota bacterium TaxID=2212470 RepID=A0ABV6YJT2_UNCEI
MSSRTSVTNSGRAAHGAVLARRLIQSAALATVLVGVFLVRGNAERWCPFGGIEAAYTYLAEGNMPCSLAVSNFYILGALLVLTLFMRRAFCSHLCPIGTISEWMRRGARRMGLRGFKTSYAADRYLGLLKYGVLIIILWITWRAGELLFRGFDPCYALISRHGEDITAWAYISGGAILVGSLLVTLPFCRWLCPLAAILQPFSRVGLARIRRDHDVCIQCGQCSRVCPAAIPVDRVRDVTTGSCVTCMECVAVCPVAEDGAIQWGPPGARPRRWPSGLVGAAVVLSVIVAVAASYALPAPSFEYSRGTLPAQTETLEVSVTDLTCRGRSNLLVFFFDRDDIFAIPGYLKIEAWPAPEKGRLRVTYDPDEANQEAILEAITEPYYDLSGDRWHLSPFAVEGYDPFGEVVPTEETP